MKRSENRILTTHVGSLVRPPELRAFTGTAKEGDPAYEAALRKATEDVVRKQAAIGIDVISDGEFGKFSWSNYILDRITGFEIRPQDLRPVRWLGSDLDNFAEFIGRDM